MSNAYLLVPGDEQECPRCHQWHLLEQPHTDEGTPYTRQMLYVTCNGKSFFAGSAGKPSVYPTRPVSRRG